MKNIGQGSKIRNAIAFTIERCSPVNLLADALASLLADLLDDFLSASLSATVHYIKPKRRKVLHQYNSSNNVVRMCTSKTITTTNIDQGCVSSLFNVFPWGHSVNQHAIHSHTASKRKERWYITDPDEREASPVV